MRIKNGLLTISILLLLAIGLFILNLAKNFLTTPIVTADTGYRYIFHPGSSNATLIKELSANGLIKHPKWFAWLIRYKADHRSLKAGEYLFPKGTTPVTLLEQMKSGTGQIYHAFTIIAGWNFKQLRATLNRDSALTHTTLKWSDAAIMQKLDRPNESPEGQFFPDTYYFSMYSSDVSLLKRSMRAMQNKFNAAWQKRAMNLPFKTPLQALTAASIVEKEAKVTDDRPLIASVIVNRLRHDMLLQCDPTVIFGVGDSFTGKITKENLQTDTPYNTYVHKGLPPTPIAIPSLDSINAVMHPAETNYYYFVATGEGGRHQFSTNLTAHHEAVAEAKNHHQTIANKNVVKASPISKNIKKPHGKLHAK